MSGEYTDPVDWPAAGWALAVWAAHFSLLWGASSVFPHQPAARWIALAGTFAALTALAVLWRSRKIEGWRSVPALAMAVAATAILLGAMPALIG